MRISHGGKDIRVRARRGVVLGTGGFEWDPALVEAFLRGPMHGAVSPPNNTGDGLRMAMAHGADLANMGEAWWVPIIQIPGDTIDGHPRSRSVRLERTRPRSIIVNRAGKRFLNEAGEYNSMAGAVPLPRPASTATSTTRRGSSSTPAPQAVRLPRRANPTARRPTGSASRPISPSWAPRPASTPTAWRARSTAWNDNVADEHRPRLRPWLKRLRRLLGRRRRRDAGRQDTRAHRHRAVLRGAGVRRRDGHQGRTAHRPRRPVLHVSGDPIPGLYAAGNAMAGVTGKAYGGAGGTLGPAMVFGYRAGHAAATGASLDY